MMQAQQIIPQLLWTGALAATPLALGVALLCRWRGLRPATRHVLWAAVLASFVTPAVGSLVWRPHWFRSDRLIAAADSVLSGAGPVAAIPPNTPDTPPVFDEPALASLPSASAPPVAPTFPAEFLPDATACSEPAALCASDVPEFESPAGAPLTVPAASAPECDGPPSTDSAGQIQTPFMAPPARIGPPAAPEAKRPRPGADLLAWVRSALSVRDAIADLPPIPGSVWFCGAALVVLLSMWRRTRWRSCLRAGTPADPEVHDLVRRIGEAMGLARTPRVLFVEAAVSPLVWCGLRPVLVLPAPLWRTLDGDSRRAVLVHELAHIRRWDHVLCWLELGIGAVYWWHPVVWWARRRLHEEAEASCDAWVTALFPSSRRAYASALLVTKSYVSTPAPAGGPWLGMASSSARRLARRITMVMTHNAAPRASIFGLCTAVLLVAAGAFVTPGLACPPDEEAKAKAAHAAKARDETPSLMTATPTVVTSQGGVRFLGEAPALEAMKGHPQQLAPAAPEPPTGLTPPTPIAVPGAPTAPAAPRAPKAPKPPKAAKAPAAVIAAPGSVWTGQATVAAPDFDRLKEGRTPREYHLSDGKLEAFYGLMSRNDVPILVQLDGDDRITIWGTEDEHGVFGRFIAIVDGSGAKAAHRGATVIDGKRIRAAIADKLSTAGLSGRAAELNAEALALDQHQFDLFAATNDRDSARKAQAEAEAVRAHAGEIRAQAAQLSQQQRRELEAAAKDLRARAEAAETSERATEQRVRELERQLRQLEERAARIERHLDSVQDRTPAKTRKSSAAPEPVDPVQNSAPESWIPRTVGVSEPV